MEQLKKYHARIKDEITKFFDEELITKSEDLVIYEHLKEYALRGKLIRGSLILLINESLGEPSRDALVTATALEIMHSCILIIDDIIDEDKTRRGKPSMHVITKELVSKSSNREHDAESIAQCIALIGTYTSYLKLSQTNPMILKQISQELIKTGFAELNEVILAQRETVTEEDVMNIYKHKTAKYTITLPIKLGYILSEAEFTDELEQITDNIGILFQIKDDLLELEQDEEEIGKSNTSDIRAGKQHYPRKLLEKIASKEDLLVINEAYKELKEEDVQVLQGMYKKYEVVQKTQDIIKKLEEETRTLIEKQEPKAQRILRELLVYVTKRKY